VTSVWCGVVRVRRPGSKADCSTTCAGQPPATWIAPACPGNVAMQITGIRPRRLYRRYKHRQRAGHPRGAREDPDLPRHQDYLGRPTPRALRGVSITPLLLDV